MIADKENTNFLEFFCKWSDENNNYCARVTGYEFNLTGNYYKNGKLFASYQKFVKRDNDIEISKEEFNVLTDIKKL